MNSKCEECGCDFARTPGFYLGSIYVNYGFVAVTMTTMYILLHFGAKLSNEWVVPPLVVYAILIPILLFRHSRAWWLAMDCVFDQIGDQEEWPPPPEAYQNSTEQKLSNKEGDA